MAGISNLCVHLLPKQQVEGRKNAPYFSTRYLLLEHHMATRLAHLNEAKALQGANGFLSGDAA